MYLDLLAKGIMIGIFISAPVGPIGALCIQQSLQNGFLIGFICGIGASLATACYGAIAGFGLQSIQDFLLSYKVLIGLIGGLFLCYLGIKTFFEKAAANNGNKQVHCGSSFFTTFFLTLTNPMTILVFLAVLNSFTVAPSDLTGSLLFILAVFLGSCLWWFLLCGFVNLFRKKMNTKILGTINKISGIIITAFGLQSFYSALSTFFVKSK